MSQRDELRMRLARAIDAQRMTFLYKEMKAKQLGCILLTLKAVYSHFYPNLPLPRDFEERVRKSIPDLATVKRYSFADLINSLNLGFVVDQQYLAPLDHRTPSGLAHLSDVPFAKSIERTLDREIRNHESPWALILIKNEGKTDQESHIMPWTDAPDEHPFRDNGMNVGGQAEFEHFMKEGFNSQLLLHFRKTQPLS